MKHPHIVVAISGHGYGHAAQVAPVVNALYHALPQLRITLRSAVPEHFLTGRIGAPFNLQYAADDFGMVQDSAFEVALEASCQAYLELERQWDRQVAAVAEELAALAPDLLLADIPYLTIAAAKSLGIPAVALCCLNWADIYGHYCCDRPEVAAVRTRIRDSYNSAERFLQTEPFMAMPGLDNLQPIGPVAAASRPQRAVIDRTTGIAPDEKLVLVALGGVATRIPTARWPRLPGIRFIVQADWQVQREDAITLESLPLSFGEVLASCDAFLTKPGYGAFTEAAVNGVPVLYIPRDDWPEQPYLVRWLERYGRCVRVSRRQVEQGGFGDELLRLLQAPPYPPVVPTGVGQAVEVLQAYL